MARPFVKILPVVPIPQDFMTFEEWAAIVVGFNNVLHGQIDPQLEWEDFAQRLTQIIPKAPAPGTHNTWQDWADSLRNALSF